MSKIIWNLNFSVFFKFSGFPDHKKIRILKVFHESFHSSKMATTSNIYISLFYGTQNNFFINNKMAEGISELQFNYKVKWSASSRWSFGPKSAWGSIKTTTIGNKHPTLA